MTDIKLAMKYMCPKRTRKLKAVQVCLKGGYNDSMMPERSSSLKTEQQVDNTTNQHRWPNARQPSYTDSQTAWPELADGSSLKE